MTIARTVLHVLVAPALAAGGLAATAAPLAAAPGGGGLVISELYVNGGSAGAPFTNKFAEIHNPTSSAVSLSGWSLQYRSASGSGTFQTYALAGSVPAGGDFLVQGGSNGSNGSALPAPDAVTSFNPANGGGTVALVRRTAALPGTFVGDVKGSASAAADVVDLVGYGTSNTFETTAGPAPSATSDARSLNRAATGADTDDNAADVSLRTPVSPCNATAGCPGTEPPEPPVDVTIAQVQGTGDTTPYEGRQVTVRGVVTAEYATGGFNGGYLQTEGTGGAIDLATHTASDGVFVYGSAFAPAADEGDHVEVTGTAKEFNGLTEIDLAGGEVTVLDEPAEPVEPTEVAFPLGAAQRESLEGMLLAPQGDYTVTNNYTTNQYAEVGLAAGTSPLPQPTDVARPGSSEYDDVVAENERRLVTLDDGASTNFLSAANQSTPLPWLRPDNEVRVGNPVTFTRPVVLDFRNGAWKLQPTRQLTADGEEPVTFGSTRTAAPEPVGGTVRLGTFNVLNYFTTTGAEFAASGGTCSYYRDRTGDPVTVDTCEPDGPRGAADAENLERQQAKIVHAINALGADVVSLEEIENSAAFGKPRNAALDDLVAALNADAGAGTWKAVDSPATIPENGEDVIRTAFVYKPAKVETVGAPDALDDPAFVNARAPLSQGFRLAGGTSATDFLVVVNHFKSKGSGSGEDADQGDGQGASNASRVKQAKALVGYVADREAELGTKKVFLTGDFNAYDREDPVVEIESAGFVNVADELTEKETYQFDGLVGSLDHVFASHEVFDDVTGADIWNINAYESVGREYSRYDANVTNLYDTGPYRASDHDPELVGFDLAEPVASTTTAKGGAGAYGRGATVAVTVKAEGATPTGEVSVTERGSDDVIGTATLADGRATVRLDGTALRPGRHAVTVAYAGSSTVAASSATATVTVVRAPTRLAVTSYEKGRLGVTVSADGFTPTGGSVLVTDGWRVVAAKVVDGRATVPLPGAGRRTLLLAYTGSAVALPTLTAWRTPR